MQRWKHTKNIKTKLERVLIKISPENREEASALYYNKWMLPPNLARNILSVLYINDSRTRQNENAILKEQKYLYKTS